MRSRCRLMWRAHLTAFFNAAPIEDSIFDLRTTASDLLSKSCQRSVSWLPRAIHSFDLESQNSEPDSHGWLTERCCGTVPFDIGETDPPSVMAKGRTVSVANSYVDLSSYLNSPNKREFRRRIALRSSLFPHRLWANEGAARQYRGGLPA